MDRFAAATYKVSMKPLLFLFCTLIWLSTSSANAGAAREVFKSAAGRSIEFFWSKPHGKGPFPLLMMIHPDQDAPRIGGQVFVDNGQLEYWTQRGFITVAISQPGFGASDGPRDFCGPDSQQAGIDLLNLLRKRTEVDAHRVFLYGGSRGAVVASMIASKDSQLRGIVLKSGLYDFSKWANASPWYNTVKLAMMWEIGWLNNEKLKERSAYYFADKIKTPLLIIHGTEDDRAPIAIAEEFAKKVNEAGGSAQFIKVESEHIIPMSKVTGMMETFFRKLE